MITTKRIAGALRDLPAFAPKLAGALRDAAATAATAATTTANAVEAVSAVAAPAAEFIDAFREGRIQLDMQDGRLGVRIKPKATQARDGRVSF